MAPLRQDKQLFSDSISKAQLLSEQFCSVFTTDTPSVACRRPYDLTYPPIPDVSIDERGVRRLLDQLNPSKAAGPDVIPAAFLKNLPEELTSAIAALSRQSVQLGVLPDAWKQAWIAPIFKKGDRLQQTMDFVRNTHAKRNYYLRHMSSLISTMSKNKSIFPS